jgi:pentapeptide repeat protein
MDLEIIKGDKTASRRVAARAAKVDLEIVLEQHRDWVKSQGQTGRQADLSRLNLEGADLTDTNLRNALLNEAVLKGADLLLTDLQGASLLQANLQGANLLGARLREANLQGASLEGATGLLAAELAGTNLTFAKLPAEVATAEDLKYISRRGRHAQWLISALLLLNALACWRILSVSDAQILRNVSLLPLPVLRNGVPLVQFFLLSPVLIGALYLWLHVYLQRFWEATAALPAIFENGRRLDQSLPWLVSWPARNCFQWLRERRSALAGVEKAICIILLYWVVPATMTLFWARYLTLQDLRGTMLHAVLIAAAVAAAIHFPRSAARAFRSDDFASFAKSVARPAADSPQTAAASADAMLAEALAAPVLPASLSREAIRRAILRRRKDGVAYRGEFEFRSAWDLV